MAHLNQIGNGRQQALVGKGRQRPPIGTLTFLVARIYLYYGSKLVSSSAASTAYASA